MFKQFTLATFAALTLSGCDLNDSDSNSDAYSGTYSFNLTLGEVNKGVANVLVTVTDNDGNALPDESVTVTPNMKMADLPDGSEGMEHGTPFSANSGALNEDGQFNTTAYFLMPSAMGDTPMGDWSIEVAFEGESKTFDINVDMATSDVKKLIDEEDQIPKMAMDTDMANMEMENRWYYLFERARMTMDDMNSFEVFIAAREDMLTYPAVAIGKTLNEGVMGAALTITNVSVEMCNTINDCAPQSINWVSAAAVADQPGVYKAIGLGLVGDDSDEVEVRLTVNDSLKTSNGTQTGLNARFAFEATGGMDMAM